MRVDFGPNCPGGVLRLAADRIHRNDHIAFDLDHPASGVAGQMIPPLFLVPKVSPIADNDGRFFPDLQCDVDRMADSHNQFHSPPVQRCLGFPQTLQHKCIVTMIGLRIIRHQSKNRHQGLLQVVGQLDGIFEGVIFFRSLGLLHPVKSEIAAGKAFWIQHLDTRRVHRAVFTRWCHRLPRSKRNSRPLLHSVVVVTKKPGLQHRNPARKPNCGQVR